MSWLPWWVAWMPTIALAIRGLVVMIRILTTGEPPQAHMTIMPDWPGWLIPRRETVSQPPEWWDTPSDAEETAVLRAQARLAAIPDDECLVRIFYPEDDYARAREKMAAEWADFEHWMSRKMQEWGYGQ